MTHDLGGSAVSSDSWGRDVRWAEPADQNAVCPLLAASLEQSPLTRWLFPNSDTHGHVCRLYARVLYEHALSAGRIDVTAELTGAAVWYPHPAGATGVPDLSVWARLIDTAPSDLSKAVYTAGRRFVALQTTLAVRQPATMHVYLAHLAVRPGAVGHRIANRLMESGHVNVDAAGFGAFLAAASPRSRDRFRRHGYQVITRFRLPWDGPLLWPMWRDPVSGDGDGDEQAPVHEHPDRRPTRTRRAANDRQGSG